MPRLIDEENNDDMDGTEWAEKNTHLTPEKYNDPTAAAIFPESDVDKNGYALGWSVIASEKRFRVNHCCQVCSIRLKEKPHLLHIHHLDRNKENNDDSNLQALCVVCHSKSQGHGHMLAKVMPSDLAYIRELQSKKP